MCNVTGMSRYRGQAMMQQKCQFYDYLEWHGIKVATLDMFQDEFRLTEPRQVRQMIKLFLKNNQFLPGETHCADFLEQLIQTDHPASVPLIVSTEPGSTKPGPTTSAQN